MTNDESPEVPAGNRLLASLPADEYARMAPDLEGFRLANGAEIYQPGEKMLHAYFPNTGIISLLASAGEESTLEVGLVGNEGMVGLPLFLGVATAANEAVVQGEGDAIRMESGPFLEACEANGKLSRLLRRFAHSMLAQVSRSAVCYRFHDADDRLARWLLMTSDRMAGGEFHLTQEFLAKMLGVRREAVNRSAVALQNAGMISYSRGHITILKREALESKACNCYEAIRGEERSFVVE